LGTRVGEGRGKTSFRAIIKKLLALGHEEKVRKLNDSDHLMHKWRSD